MIMPAANIYFDKETLHRLERFAQEKGLSRSAAARYCIRTCIKDGNNRA